MKSKCLLLLKVQIQNLAPKKKWGAKQVFLAAMYGILLAMLASYSFGLSFGLGFLNMEKLVPGCAVVVPGLVIFFFTMLKTNGIMFGYKDYDMLMALPVPTRTVIASRFLLLYLFHLGITAFVLVPMGVGYFLWAEKSVLAVVMWMLGILLVPLIPTVAATLASFGSTAVIPEEGFTPEQIGAVGEMLSEEIYRMYPPARWFSGGILSGNVLLFLLFAGTSAGFYLLFVLLVSKNYKKMNTGLMTHRTKGNYKVGKVTAKSPVTAICQKEARRFFGSTTYCVNMGIGVLMSLLFAVAACFATDEKLVQMLGMQIPEQIFQGAVPLLVGVLAMMTCTTSVSMSLEGKNLWILKSLPIAKEDIYKGKIRFNLMLQIPVSLISAALLAVRFHYTGAAILLLFAYPVAAAFAGSVWGLFINLKLPVYDWMNEMTVIKQSASSLCGILFGMVLTIPFLAAVVFAGTYFIWILGAEIAGLLLFAAGLWNYCRRVEF